MLDTQKNIIIIIHWEEHGSSRSFSCFLGCCLDYECGSRGGRGSLRNTEKQWAINFELLTHVKLRLTSFFFYFELYASVY